MQKAQQQQAAAYNKKQARAAPSAPASSFVKPGHFVYVLPQRKGKKRGPPPILKVDFVNKAGDSVSLVDMRGNTFKRHVSHLAEFKP